MSCRPASVSISGTFYSLLNSQYPLKTGGGGDAYTNPESGGRMKFSKCGGGVGELTGNVAGELSGGELNVGELSVGE